MKKLLIALLAVFDDAGTPDNIYDDEIVGLVYSSGGSL